MSEYGVHEAQANFLRLLDEAAAGEDVVITRNGGPVARLVPLPAATPRRLGQDTGVFAVPVDFDQPLPEEALASFER